jgi:hypothetical protein
MADDERAVRLFQNGISQRQKELHRVAEILGREAKDKANVSAGTKVITIILGAIVATQGVVVKVLGTDTAVLFLSAIGVVISAATGIEAAFKLEKKSAELEVLAAECQSTIWQTDSEWYLFAAAETTDEKIKAGQKLMARQDKALAEVQRRAAQLQVNITSKVHEQYEQEGHRPAAA